MGFFSKEQNQRPQMIGQKVAVSRKAHVWYKRQDGKYKCISCGGIADKPTYDGDVIRYEALTDEERVNFYKVTKPGI